MQLCYEPAIRIQQDWWVFPSWRPAVSWGRECWKAERGVGISRSAGTGFYWLCHADLAPQLSLSLSQSSHTSFLECFAQNLKLLMFKAVFLLKSLPESRFLATHYRPAFFPMCNLFTTKWMSSKRKYKFSMNSEMHIYWRLQKPGFQIETQIQKWLLMNLVCQYT